MGVKVYTTYVRRGLHGRRGGVQRKKRSAVMLRKMMEESFASRRGGDHVDLEHDGNLLLKILLRNRPLVAIDEPGGPLDQFTLSAKFSKEKILLQSKKIVVEKFNILSKIMKN